MKILSFLFYFGFSTLCTAQITWHTQNSGVNRELTGVSFVDQNNGWICGWTETMLHTTNGGTDWIQQTIPPNNAYYNVFFTDLQNGWACGYAGQIIHTTDGGQNWVVQTSPTNTDLYSIFFINPEVGWIAGGDGGSFPSYINHRVILSTTNGGNTWSVQIGQAYQSQLKSIVFLDDNIGYAAGLSGIIEHTTDGGNNWIEQQVISSYDFSDVFFSNDSTGFVVGDYLGLPHYGVIFKTTNGGVNWNEIPLGADELILGIYFTDEQNGWAVGNDYGSGNIGIVYRTTDGGDVWSKQTIPLVDALFSVFFINNTTGWAAGHIGTIIATDNVTPVELSSFTAEVENNDVNLNWQTATETNNKGFEIKRSNSKSEIKNQEWEAIGFVNGHGTSTEKNNYSFVDKNLQPGRYSYKLIQVDYDGTRNESKIINIDINSQPSDFSLKQNYPNPFNPSTTIEYSIPKSSEVKLKIYNTLGEEIKTLVNSFKQAGKYKVNLDLSKFSSGVYFYRLKAGSYNQTRKMILLR